MTTREDTHGCDYFTSLFLLPQLCNSTEAGRFSIDDLDLATTCTFGSLVAAIQLAMESEPRDDRDQLFARAMLRMVGVPADEATEVAARALPEIDVQSGPHT